MFSLKLLNLHTNADNRGELFYSRKLDLCSCRCPPLHLFLRPKKADILKELRFERLADKNLRIGKHTENLQETQKNKKIATIRIYSEDKHSVFLRQSVLIGLRQTLVGKVCGSANSK